MWIAVIWLVLAVVVGAAAGPRGRSGFGWFLLAVLLSPLVAGLILAILPDLKMRGLLERVAEAGAVDDAELHRAIHGKYPRGHRREGSTLRAWLALALVVGLMAFFYALDHHRLP